ncbi:hypothetical protein GCM10027268_11320 [Brachybacterium huguangmaarense]
MGFEYTVMSIGEDRLSCCEPRAVRPGSGSGTERRAELRVVRGDRASGVGLREGAPGLESVRHRVPDTRAPIRCGTGGGVGSGAVRARRLDLANTTPGGRAA